MADTLKFSGSVTTARLNTGESGEPDVDMDLEFPLTVKRKTSLRFDLSTDDPVSLNLAAMGYAGVHVLCIVPSGGYITAGITTADGASSLSTDALLFRQSTVRPVTALTLTRQPATAVTVRVFLAEKTS